MCLRAKFRGSPKALITKDKKLLIRPIHGGIVTSLKIIVIGMGDRGSKSIIGGGINLSSVPGSRIPRFSCKRATSRWFFSIKA